MTHPQCSEDAFCPQYHHAIELIGRRWTGAILRVMLHGATRFSDLAASVPDLSDKMLALRLRELEAEGVVERRVFAETPVRIEYRLTPKGLELDQAVRVIESWADHWLAPATAQAPAPAAVASPGGS